MTSHWGELPWTRMESGHIAGDWQNPTGDRSVVTGVKRVRIDAGKWSTPAHVENSEEEIFYVLSGSGGTSRVARGSRVQASRGVGLLQHFRF